MVKKNKKNSQKDESQENKIINSFEGLRTSMLEDLRKDLTQHKKILREQFNTPFEDMVNQLQKAMSPAIETPIIGLSKDFKERMESLATMMKDISKTLTYSFDVDEEELEKAVDTLTKKGYFLNFFIHTPRNYIELYEIYQKSEEIEDFNYTYAEYLGFNDTDILSDYIREIIQLVPEGWKDTLIKINEDIAVSEELEVENVRIYIYMFYALLEAFLIEVVMTLENKDADNWQLNDFRDKEGAFNAIKEEISEFITDEKIENYLKRMLDNGKQFFFSRIEATKVNRNSVLHGFIAPQQIEVVNFYQITAFLANWAFYCVERQVIIEEEK